MLTDPIADMLSRIRNANRALHDRVEMPTSRMKEEIARLLKEEGYIRDYRVISADSWNGAHEKADDRALHGLTRSLLANMVEGVTNGFQKRLEIQGVGYRASLRGTDLELNVGLSHPVVLRAPAGIT